MTLARLLLSLLAAALAVPATAADRSGSAGFRALPPVAGQGITPGGLVYRVSPARRELVLTSAEGVERAAFRLLADERYVLGVADDGSRVTSPAPSGVVDTGGLREANRTERTARFIFRDPTGQPRARREVPLASESMPAASGAEVATLRREGADYVVYRSSAAEEGTRVFGVPAAEVRREAGKLEAVRLHFSGAGLAAEFRGSLRSLFVRDTGKEPVRIPAGGGDCGPEDVLLAIPRGEDSLAVVIERFDGDARERRALVETLDRDGSIVEESEVQPAGTFLPLPDGGFLVQADAALIRFDRRDAEVSRAPFRFDDADRGSAARLASALQRLRALGARATGSDWAEMALIPGAMPWELSQIARSDPAGALDRLRRVADGSPEEATARRILLFLRESVAPRGRGGRGPGALLDLIEERAADAPAWFRRQAALLLVARRGRPAPAWATAAAAEAIAAGEAQDLDELPDDVLTPELAEAVTALDAERLDRFEPPDLGVPYEDVAWNASANGPDADPPRFHVPARRFAAALLDCLPGAGRAKLEAAVNALAAPGQALAARREAAARESAAPTTDPPDDGAAGPPANGPADALAPLIAALVAARRSPDPTVRAAAQIASPPYGLPLDPAAFRADVLTREETLPLALKALLADRSLPAREWTRLFADGVQAARRRSPDPAACAMAFFRERDPEEEEAFDPYCLVIAPLTMGERADTPSPRRAELDAWSHSSAAPSEVQFQSRIGRLFDGTATEKELLEIWRARELPWTLRQIVFWEPSSDVASKLAGEWRRALREDALTPAEEATLLEALRKGDPEAAGRLAAECWQQGRVPLGATAEQLQPWVASLDAAAIAASPLLARALEAHITDERVGPAIALLLAKAGDAGALPEAVFALKIGCLPCTGKEEILAVFRPFGAAGEAALRELCLTVPSADMAAAALEALYESSPDTASALAEERLERSLASGCVPGRLVSLMAEKSLTPFDAVAERLAALGCERRRLRPSVVQVGSGRAGPARRALEEASTRVSPAPCKAAFDRLFGLVKKDAYAGLENADLPDAAGEAEPTVVVR